MARYQTTYKHKDLGDIELVKMEDLKADTPEGATEELNQKKPAYITYTRIEKLDDMDARKTALNHAVELTKTKPGAKLARVLERAEEYYQFLIKK